MSKGLGPNQKKVLACFESLYKEMKHSKFLEDIHYIGIDTLIIIILSLFYHIKIKNIEKLPIKKKQAVYNAIEGLEEKGWVKITPLTDSFMTKPPINYKAITAQIKDGRIYNYKKHNWIDLKHLIGTTVL